MFGRLFVASCIGVSALALLTGCETSPGQVDANTAQRSAPNVYEGYSKQTYDGYERSSFYVPVRDGTRLAVDLFRPTLNGELADEKLPVIWMHTPYNRRSYRGEPAAKAYPGYALELLPYGYNVAVVDFRGVYASFGTNIAYNRGEWVDEAKWDAYDITEWLADQPWSNGNIGMWGCSATGGSQMQALTTNPPSLKAVVPMSAELDVWPFAMSGGIPRDVAVTTPGTTASQAMIARRDAMAVPVDGPDAEALLEQAKAEHKDNIESVGLVYFRDSISEATGLEWWKVSSPHTYIDELNAARTTGSQMVEAIDWLEASPDLHAGLLEKIDTDRLAVMGQSCGGLMTLEASIDPRVDTIGVVNSGAFNPGNAPRMSLSTFTKDDLKDVHTPALYIDGGTNDTAFENSNDDFERLNHIPVFYGVMEGAGHIATHRHKNGGRFAEVITAWLEWQLKSDKTAEAWFAGEDCGLCEDPAWIVQRKQFD